VGTALSTIVIASSDQSTMCELQRLWIVTLWREDVLWDSRSCWQHFYQNASPKANEL